MVFLNLLNVFDMKLFNPQAYTFASPHEPLLLPKLAKEYASASPNKKQKILRS